MMGTCQTNMSNCTKSWKNYENFSFLRTLAQQYFSHRYMHKTINNKNSCIHLRLEDSQTRRHPASLHFKHAWSREYNPIGFL